MTQQQEIESLLKGAGARQRIILLELWAEGYFHQDASGYWCRGVFQTRQAKNLVRQDDIPVQEQIDKLAPDVRRIEALSKQLQRVPAFYGGSGRRRLSELETKRDRIQSNLQRLSVDTAAYFKNDLGVSDKELQS